MSDTAGEKKPSVRVLGTKEFQHGGGVARW